MISSGLLSSGAVSIGNSGGSKLGLTRDMIYNSSGEVSTPDFLSNLKLKRESRSGTPGADDDDDEDDNINSINMTKEYRYLKKDTVYFPVRPFRDDGIQREEPKPIVKVEGQDPNIKQEPGTVENSATPMIVSLPSSRESTIKSEAIEEKLEMIKESKSKLESKIVQADPIAIEESNKLISDYQQLLDVLNGKFQDLAALDDEEEEEEEETQVKQENGEEGEDDGTGDIEILNGAKEVLEPKEKEVEDKYALFQLPKYLPVYTPAPTKVKLEKGLKPVDVDYTPEEMSKLATHNSRLRGQVGKINIHQSGKITIDLGNGIRLNVTKGAPTDFLQELALVEMAPPKEENGEDEDIQMVDTDGRSIKGKVVRLGTVNEKIVATPCIQ
ncbi:DNA-directed RNA polymerase III subunit, putative [Candida maltosa Xu316]|uniref:DNA-directed RNA polymerase III subunit, putative n=1 Tax=Candida maltosa (strain Xu316) TaxID=1245528 RepID=M3HF54_CANMX|nr:DNA-directed RNA polymerase III subunit, putative [Candida maltosa Xu316]